MALDFPALPSDGDQYEGYVWNDAIGVWELNSENARLVNTDNVPGRTIFVGSLDPDGVYDLEDGDVWIQTY